MKEERLWELVSLKLSGEALPEDLAELYNLLKEYPHLSFKVDLITQVWFEQSKNSGSAEDSFNKHLQRLSNHFTSPALQYDTESNKAEILPSKIKVTNKKAVAWGSAIAATFFFVVILTYLLYVQKKPLELSQNIVTTKPGSKSKLTLPDGTQVWLNSDSKITYDEKFGNDVREVQLTGEAYFDVVKDKNRPFIIHSKVMDIKVLGTAFNVRAYPDEKTFETSLIRGIIEVTLKNNPDKKIILRPNEKLIIQDKPEEAPGKHNEIPETEEKPLLTLSNVRYFKNDSSSVETSWIKNKLAFDSESFELVAKKIEKWYGVHITIKGTELKNVEFTGLFEDETLPEVMDALRLTGSFKYSINRREVTVQP